MGVLVCFAYVCLIKSLEGRSDNVVEIFFCLFFVYLAFFCLIISLLGRRGEVVEIGVEIIQAYDPSLLFNF